MPARLQLLRRAAISLPTRQPYHPLAPFLYPFLGQQRCASILSSLSDNKGAYKSKIKRGRGPASGKGKTSGRGHKGQGQHGKVPAGFNGGQTPDWQVQGTRGFKNHFTVNLSRVNLDRVQYWIDKGLLDPSQPITLKELNSSRCVHGVKDGVKLLARGKDSLRTPIHLIVSRASAEAINIVEGLGGTVTTRYYSPFAIKKVMSGEMDPIHSDQSRIVFSSKSTTEGLDSVVESSAQERLRYRYRLPDPTSRKDLEYYRDAAHRGYLSHLVQEGHGPSLFFKTPGAGKKDGQKLTVRAKSQQRAENRMW